MKHFKYQVFVPDFIVKEIGFTTKEFENENLFTARNFALEYLSEVIFCSFKKKIFSLSTFENEESSEVSELFTLSQTPFYVNENILNFQYLSECKIKYNYNKEHFAEALETKKGKEISLAQAFLLLGTICLQIEDYKGNYSKIFDFRNFEGYVDRLAEKKCINRLIENVDLSNLPSLYSKLHFTLKFKHQEFREIFLQTGNNMEKEFLSSDHFFELEKKFLSICNHQCMVSLFVDQKSEKWINKALHSICFLYGTKVKFVLTPNVLIKNNLYSVFFFNYKMHLNLIYSKIGKLYFRDESGMKEADENTKVEEIFCDKKCFETFFHNLKVEI